MTLQGY